MPSWLGCWQDSGSVDPIYSNVLSRVRRDVKGGSVSGHWRRTTIGAEVTFQRGFDITKKEQRPGTVPVISSSGVSSFHDTATVRGPGVVIGRKGTLGTAFYVAEDFWPHDTTLWVTDFHGNEPEFVYYFFRSYDVTRLDVGSSNPTLNRNPSPPP